LVIYVCVLVAVSLLVDSMTIDSVSAQGTTKSNATEASEEAQNTPKPLEEISTIQSLLNQAVIEYDVQNFTGAIELAQTAYLDNYEHLEALFGQLVPALKEATETMMREDVQSALEPKVPLSDLQQLVITVDGKLTTTQQLFD
jgi:hypothetical protein